MDNSGEDPNFVTSLLTWDAEGMSTQSAPGQSVPGVISGNVNFYIGITTVEYVATDAAGRNTSCQVTVTITDEETPVLTCSPDVNTDVKAAGPPGHPYATVILNGSQALATDNSGVPSSVLVSAMYCPVLVLNENWMGLLKPPTTWKLTASLFAGLYGPSTKEVVVELMEAVVATMYMSGFFFDWNVTELRSPFMAFNISKVKSSLPASTGVLYRPCAHSRKLVAFPLL